jgi:hypothetical protein
MWFSRAIQRILNWFYAGSGFWFFRKKEKLTDTGFLVFLSESDSKKLTGRYFKKLDGLI